MRSYAKFGAKKRAEYLRLVSEDGLGRMMAAKAIGVSHETIRTYCQDFPEFVAQREDAELAANEQVENAMYQAALSGNVTACQVWLYNRLPGRWADKRRTEMTGPDGGPIQHEYDFSHLSDEEIERAISETESAEGGTASEAAEEAEGAGSQ